MFSVSGRISASSKSGCCSPRTLRWRYSFRCLQQDPFRLDAVQIRIDGELATHHIYSFKELDALKSGGIQRIFTGNYGTGAHQLEVSVIGKLENGKDYKESRQFTFDKGIDPRLLGVALAGSSAEAIELQNW